MTLDRPRDDKKGRVVLKFFARFAARSIGGIRVAGAVAGLATLVSVWGSAAVADPAEDALAELNELSQQAEHLAETIHTAQVDLDKKLQVLREADEAYAVNVAALNSARTKLVNYQGAVDALAAAVIDRLRFLVGFLDAQLGLPLCVCQQTLASTLCFQQLLDRDSCGAWPICAIGCVVRHARIPPLTYCE